MFKKLNVKTLIILLVILAGIYFLSEMMGSKDRSFRNVVVEIDTANVTDIYIKIPADKQDIVLSRTGENDWQVSGNGNKFTADRSMVRNILGQFSEMKPERIAATSPDKWDAFEVSDSTGTRVTVKNNNEELADIFIGKFSYTQPPQGQQQQQQQQRGKMTSFVRLADENEVYAVDGFLKMAYQNDVNSYRNKTLTDINKNDVLKVEFRYPDRTITIENEGGKWMMNGGPADSANTVKYLNKIAKLNSPNFVDPSTQKISDATQTVTIEGSNFSPVVLKAFPTSDTLIQFIVTSSVNPEAEFDGAKAKLHEKIFVDETAFLPDQK